MADPAAPPAAPADPPAAALDRRVVTLADAARRRVAARPAPGRAARPAPAPVDGDPPGGRRAAPRGRRLPHPPPRHRDRTRRPRARVERHERADVERLAETAGFAQTLRHLHVRDRPRAAPRRTADELDQARVTELAGRVLAERPGLRRPGPPPAGGSRLDGAPAREPGLFDLVEQSKGKRRVTIGGQR